MVDALPVLKNLLKEIGVFYTNDFVESQYLSHSAPDSLLAISDTLKQYNISSIAVKLDADQLTEIPLPCVVQLKGSESPYFSLLKKIEGDQFAYLDEQAQTITKNKQDFLAHWTGITLLIENDEHSVEPDYQLKLKKRRLNRGIVTLLIVIGLYGIFNNFLSLEFSFTLVLGASLIFLLKLFGLAISILLLKAEVKDNDQTLATYCSGGKNVDCKEVIQSFSIAGSLSISTLAFAYFATGLLVFILPVFSATSLGMLCYLTLISLLIIPASLIYQWKVIKKWCKLCLWISGVLLLELCVSVVLLWGAAIPAISELGMFSIVFLTLVLLWINIKPKLLIKNELYQTKSKLHKFLSDQDIFYSQLNKSRQVQNRPEGLGIMLKGDNPKFHVLKVCNPYCGPCAKTHPILEELFASGDIDLQVIFHPGGEDAIKHQTISHLLAVAAQANQEDTKRALDDWYLPKDKDYEVFASKYPMNGELKAQEAMIQAMLHWCEKENISYTPTIFINGFELPKSYSAEDLKYILI